MELAASESPERPAGVPEGGTWNDTLGKWEAVARTGPGGARQGECLRFRPDGTLFSRCRFVADVEEGPFTVYHPDGTIAREGQYVAGRVDGLVRAHASSDGSGEPLRSCCVPPGATRMDIRYRAGDYVLEVFYDREGRALLADGNLRPACPASLPDLVTFEEARGAWVSRGPTLDRWWTVDGVLYEEQERQANGRRVIRLYEPTGREREERGEDAEGRLVGPFRRRFVAEGTDAAKGEAGPPETVGWRSPYADPRIREERGSFEAGQAVGVWTFLDEAGAVVRTVDRGVAAPATLAEVSPAFAPVLEDGWALARELLGQSRVREALCAAARAAVRAGASQVQALAAFLGEHVVALAPGVDLERGEALIRASDVDVPRALNALVCGVDAALVFRALATVIPGAGPAVVELVEASLLLAPDRPATHITRALVRAQRGDEAGARADMRVVAADAPEAGASLASYLDVVFRPFAPPTLWAELKPPPASEAGQAVPVGQSLEAIQNAAAVYATRLGVVRQAILDFIARGAADVAGSGSPPPWLPPDLSILLPDGPVELNRETIACDPNPDTGEAESIEIDEQVTLDGLTVPGLLAIAHADHAALAWLCWATGLEHIALPRAIEPPATLVAGIQAIVQRHWRVEDRTKSGGLIALAKGVAGFEWHGQAVDEMPPHILSVARAELLAVRSMFLWLLAADAMSPFQDDIRDM